MDVATENRSKNFERDTALHVSSENTCTETVSALLDDKAQSNIQNVKGCIPLQFSTQMGDPDIVEHFLKHQADVNVRTRKGYTALHQSVRCASDDVTSVLLDNGADPNAKDHCGYTPLHVSAYMGRPETVKLLLQHSVDVNAQANNGYTALHFSALRRRTDIVSLLVKNGADVDRRDIYGISPLHWSARRGHKEVVALLMSKNMDANPRTIRGHTPLHWSAFSGLIETAQLLLDRNADINALTETGLTALHISARSGREDFVKFLISKGAAIDMCDSKGLTAFDHAQKFSHTRICFVLNNLRSATPPLSQMKRLEMSQNRFSSQKVQVTNDRPPLSEVNVNSGTWHSKPGRPCVTTVTKHIGDRDAENKPEIEHLHSFESRASSRDQEMEDLRPAVERIFAYFVKTRNLLHKFDFLKKCDRESVETERKNYGETAAAHKLFNLLPWNRKTYSYILRVLRKRRVKLHHAADMMEEYRELKTDAADVYMNNNDCLIKAIRDDFANSIIPSLVLRVFNKYSPVVLTKEDISYLEAFATDEGEIEGSHKLLDCISIYENWFTCLLEVLKDPNVKLEHVAQKMLKLRSNQMEEHNNSQSEAVEDEMRNLTIVL